MRPGFFEVDYVFEWQKRRLQLCFVRRRTPRTSCKVPLFDPEMFHRSEILIIFLHILSVIVVVRFVTEWRQQAAKKLMLLRCHSPHVEDRNERTVRWMLVSFHDFSLSERSFICSVIGLIWQIRCMIPHHCYSRCFHPWGQCRSSFLTRRFNCGFLLVSLRLYLFHCRSLATNSLAHTIYTRQVLRCA
jgi:hypothetical protein